MWLILDIFGLFSLAVVIFRKRRLTFSFSNVCFYFPSTATFEGPPQAIWNSQPHLHHLGLGARCELPIEYYLFSVSKRFNLIVSLIYILVIV